MKKTDKKPEPASLKLPLGEWLRINSGLQELCRKDENGRDLVRLPVAVAFDLGRLARLLEPVIQEFVAQRDKLLANMTDQRDVMKADVPGPFLTDADVKPLTEHEVEVAFAPFTKPPAETFGEIQIGVGTMAALTRLFAE